MRRRYDTAQFACTVEEIRRAWPDAGITTDVIVGFPGEGEAEYRESRQLAAAMGFSAMHVFPFSPRPGTSAAYLNDSVPARVKKDRAVEMSLVAADGFRAFRTQQLGRARPVLWESAARSGKLSVWGGLTDNYIRVRTEDERDLRNAITEARLLELAGDHVISKVA
jgi:threonylcarbamoyladenosine tRNA methylthiotransferase MtaB